MGNKYFKNYLRTIFFFIIIISSCVDKGKINNVDEGRSVDVQLGEKKMEQIISSLSSASNNKPVSVLERFDENPKLTLINLIRFEAYSPGGYRIYALGDKDKYGNQGSEEDRLIVYLTESQVEEIKKYNDSYIFWESEFGKKVVNKMIDCFNKGMIKCDCKTISF
jgi:hypothetical protein